MALLVFLKSSFYLITSIVLSKGVGFILTLLSARFLDKETFGVLSYLRATSAMFEGATTGANSNLVLNSSLSTRECSSIVKSYTIYLAVFLLGIASILLVNTGYLSHIRGIELLFVAVLYVASALLSLINAVYIRKGLTKQMVQLGSVSGVMTILIGGGALVTFGYLGAMVAFVFYFSFDLILKAIKISKLGLFNFSFTSDFSLFKRSLRYLVFTMLPLAFFWGMKGSLISTENGAEKLADFELTYQFVTICMIAIGAISSTMLVKIGEDFRYAYISLVVTLIIGGVFIVGFALFGDLVFVYFGEEYAQLHNDAMRIILIIIPYGLYSILSKINLSLKMDRVNVLASLVAVVFSLLYSINLDSISAIALSEVYISYYTVFVLLSCLNLTIIKIRAIL